MKKIILITLATLLAYITYGQIGVVPTGTSVFENMNPGTYKGTVNGVLFLKNQANKDVILDFQGSQSALCITGDDSEEEIWGNRLSYKAKTTSGSTSIEHNIFSDANRLSIKLSSGTYSISTIDGACDEGYVAGISYYYQAEAATEYLVLYVEEELTLTNDADYSKGVKTIKLLPHSTLVFATKRTSSK